MKAPKKYQQGKRIRFERPDVEWLEDQYWTQDKSASKIAKEIDATTSTILRWLDEADVSLRSLESIHQRQSEFMSSAAGPAWKGGTSRKYGKNLLFRSEVPYKCSWCYGLGDLNKLRDYDMHVHHKDHNKHNNTLENLCWLCGACHRLETALWNLLKQDKIDLACEGRTMVVTFK